MKLWKHKQSGIWRVRFTIGGKRVQVSLKTTAKGEAEALAPAANPRSPELSEAEQVIGGHLAGVMG